MANNELKFVIVGDGACGKTCALSVFHSGKFPSSYIPTVFETYQCDLNVGNTSLKMTLFDTAGQDDYDRLRPLSYPNTDVVMILFDVSQPNSLANAESKWLDEIRHYCKGVPIILCGNKTDLRDDGKIKSQLSRYNQHPVTESEGLKVATDQGLNGYQEFSAMQNIGVQEAFNKAAYFGYCKKNRKPVPLLSGQVKNSGGKKKKPGCAIL